jgi:hypothetical protein
MNTSLKICVPAAGNFTAAGNVNVALRRGPGVVRLDDGTP